MKSRTLKVLAAISLVAALPHVASAQPATPAAPTPPASKPSYISPGISAFISSMLPKPR